MTINFITPPYSSPKLGNTERGLDLDGWVTVLTIQDLNFSHIFSVASDVI